VTPQSSTSDPAETEALQCLEKGTAKLEEGDVQGAKEFYRRSTEIKRTASSLFNLGVTYYHLSKFSPCISIVAVGSSVEEFDDAIAAWKESIALQPSSPDAHTSTLIILELRCCLAFLIDFPSIDLASAYIISPGMSNRMITPSNDNVHLS